MTHDPMCEDWLYPSDPCAICLIIARVREDERHRVGLRRNNVWDDAYLAALDAAEAAVTLDVVNRGLDAYDDEFLSRSCPHPDGSDSVCYECAKERVVQEVKDAIRSLKEKP